MKKRLVLFLLFFFAVLPLAAQYALPAELLPRAERAVQKEYPNANYVTLSDRVTVRYQADGRAVERSESWEKVLTPKGRRDLRGIRIGFSSFFERVEVPVLEVYRPDGQVIRVDAAKTGRVATESSQMEENIYDPDHRVFEVALPEIAVGDVVHRVVVETTLRPRIPGVWCGYFMLQSDEPVLAAEVVITGPEKVPLRAITVRDRAREGGVTADPPQHHADGTVTWRWRAANVPAVVPEEDMPPLYTVVQRLLVSTAASWSEIAEWYGALCEPHVNARSPELKAKVAELCRGAASEEEKIARLFRYASQEIRYMGVTTEKTAPGYEPHDIRETFFRKHGICRDKAALLVAMLREAGIRAYPVLFMYGRPKDAEVPNNFFNHAIAAVELPGGQYRLLDPTGENAPLELSSALSNMSYLVARKNGETLRRTAVVPAKRNLVKIASHLAVDHKGELSGKTTIRFDGINDDAYRNFFVSSPEALRRQFFDRALKKQFSGAVLTALVLKPADLRDRSQNLTAEITYRVPGYLPESPNEFSLITPAFCRRFGVANFLLSNCGPESRVFPLLVKSACGVEETFELQLPPDCRTVFLPPQGRIDQPGLVTFDRHFTAGAGGVLKGTQSFCSHAVEIPPDRYQAYRTALQRVESLCRSCPLAQWDYRFWTGERVRPYPGKDLLILNSSTAFTQKAPGVWEMVEKRSYRVLTFAGVQKAAEIKIPYNPVWDEVRIQAEVRLPDGSHRQLRPSEINVMDEAWVATAPRYPAGKILVASLPGIVPGSTVEYTLTCCAKDRPIFAGSYCFAEADPVVEERLSITTVPHGRTLKFSPAPYGADAVFRTAPGGTATHVWSMTDVPAYATEPMQPPAELFAMPLYFSDGRYPEYAAQLKKVLERLSSGQKACEALGRELCLKADQGPSPAAGKPERARLKKRVLLVRDWAARNLRHAGPALNELPFSSLSPGDITLKSGYGNSTDLAIALAAICRGAGIRTSFTAASQLPAIMAYQKMLKEYPQPVFGSVLVEVPELGLYLNDTDEYAAPGALAAHGCIGLELEHGALVTLRASHGNAPLESRKYVVRIAPDGRAEVEYTSTFFGLEHARANRFWEKTVGPAREKALADFISEFSRRASMTRPPEIDFGSSPGIIRLHFTIPDFAPLQNGYRQFRLPGYDVWQSALSAGSVDRDTPFYRPRSRRIETEWQIQLPQDSRWVATRPAQITGGEYGSGRLRSDLKIEPRITGTVLHVRNDLLLPAEMIPASRYGDLVQLQKKLADPAMDRIILKKIDVSAIPEAKEKK